MERGGGNPLSFMLYVCMVGEILNQGGERLQNPSTPRAVNPREESLMPPLPRPPQEAALTQNGPW